MKGRNLHSPFANLRWPKSKIGLYERPKIGFGQIPWLIAALALSRREIGLKAKWGGWQLKGRGGRWGLAKWMAKRAQRPINSVSQFGRPFAWNSVNNPTHFPFIGLHWRCSWHFTIFLHSHLFPLEYTQLDRWSMRACIERLAEKQLNSPWFWEGIGLPITLGIHQPTILYLRMRAFWPTFKKRWVGDWDLGTKSNENWKGRGVAGSKNDDDWKRANQRMK